MPIVSGEIPSSLVSTFVLIAEEQSSLSTIRAWLQSNREFPECCRAGPGRRLELLPFCLASPEEWRGARAVAIGGNRPVGACSDLQSRTACSSNVPLEAGWGPLPIGAPPLN